MQASCCAEESSADQIYEFAKASDAEEIAREAYEYALEGRTDAWKSFLSWAKEKVEAPVRSILSLYYLCTAPAFLLVVMRSACFYSDGSSSGVRLLLRMILLLGFSEIAGCALKEAEQCMCSAAAFSEKAAPAVAALFTSMGMSGTAAQISPAAALAGGIAENVFKRYGLPLCRVALCLSIAGNLSERLNLRFFVQFIRKLINWGTGLATTLFTALIALQGNSAEVFDGVAIKTAKFAVDSAAPVIGNGMSDAWESYVSGIMISKNALGMSGIVALLATGLKPVICCAAAMLVLSLTGAFLEFFGEKETAQAASQIGGICQMCLSLAIASLVIAMVLLGAAMAAGRNLMS